MLQSVPYNVIIFTELLTPEIWIPFFFPNMNFSADPDKGKEHEF